MAETALKSSPEEIIGSFEPAFIDELYGMIDALPQRQHLTEERIDRWLSAILSFEPERAKWHIKRLSGLGGSEIGTVVAPFVGVYDPFDTPKDIYLDKLMFTIPQPPNGHMKRGTFLEDDIREAFQKKYQFQSRTDDMAKFAGYANPDHPWLVGNPDEYGILSGMNFMADYKCPMPGFKDKYEKYGVSFGYIAQLHHYTLIARELKLPVDGLLLCSWDMENWDVDVRSIELNEHLMEKILEAGDWLWNDCILAGKMPKAEYAPRITVTDDDADAEKLRRLIEESSKLSVLANKAYARDKEIKVEIANILESRRLGNTKLVYGVTDITAKEELDLDKAKAFLERFGLKTEDFMVQTGEMQSDLVYTKALENGLDLSDCKAKVLDEEAMVQALLDRNIDREQFIKEKVSIALSRSKVPEVAEALSGMKDVAEETIGDFSLRLKGHFMPGRGVPDQAKETKSKGMRM